MALPVTLTLHQQSFTLPLTQILAGSVEAQRLYYNLNGRSRTFNATRLEDDRAARGVAAAGAMTTEERAKNVLYIIQVPLISESPTRGGGVVFACSLGGGGGMAMPAAASFSYRGSEPKARGMDHAILGVGDMDLGKYPGVKNQCLRRDTRLPIRCTIQYYHVTDESQVTEAAMTQISEELQRAYTTAQAVGSLVTETTRRATEGAPAAVTTALSTFA